MRVILLVCTFLLGINYFFPIETSYAAKQKLDDVSINIDLHNDGSATITETIDTSISNKKIMSRQFSFDEYTQLKSYYIKENGEKYEQVDHWDNAQTAEDIAFKTYVHAESKNEVEIIWGVDKNGDHTYELVYTVSNFVRQVNDAQSIIWEFLSNFNEQPENMSIAFNIGHSIEEEELELFVSGMKVDAKVKDNSLVIKPMENTKKTDFLFIILKLPMGTFKPQIGSDDSFNALKNTYIPDIEATDIKTKSNKISYTPLIIFLTIFAFGIIILVIFLLTKRTKRQIEREAEIKSIAIDTANDVNPSLPTTEHFLDLFFFLTSENMASTSTLIRALLVKWFLEERITIKYEKNNNKILKNKHKKYLAFHHRNKPITHPIEREFFQIFSQIKGNEQYFQVNQFHFPQKLHRQYYQLFVHTFLEHTLSYVLQQSYLSKELSNSFTEIFTYQLTDKGKELQHNLYAFTHYLMRMEEMDQYYVFDDKQAKEYLIWASLMDIEVALQESIHKISPANKYSKLLSNDAMNVLSTFSNKYFVSAIENYSNYYH